MAFEAMELVVLRARDVLGPDDFDALRMDADDLRAVAAALLYASRACDSAADARAAGPPAPPGAAPDSTNLDGDSDTDSDATVPYNMEK